MKTLEQRLADLWLGSVHCSAAVHDLAWRKPPTRALQAAIATVCEVPGVLAVMNDKITAHRAYLTRKGHKLPA